MLPSQPGSVAPPHAAPARVSAFWHVPMAVALSPTHERPLPHGWALSHADSSVPRTWHRSVDATQTCAWSHAEVAHESPGAGGAAQTPHAAFFVPPQKPLAHWPLNAHAPPAGCAPA